jgi:GNAT superfamily N-acetyltransferase
MFQIQDGRTASFRQATPQDCDLIREFVCGLTPLSQYQRFFAAVAPPSRGLLKALCSDDARSDIFIAVDRSGTVVGHGMAADRIAADGMPVSHLGLVVADSWQLNGLGTALMDLLITRARQRGVEALVMDVLPANSRMLGMIERRWPRARREYNPDSVLITARIDAGRPSLPNPSLPNPSLPNPSLPSPAGQHRLPGRTRPAQLHKEPAHAA